MISRDTWVGWWGGEVGCAWKRGWGLGGPRYRETGVTVSPAGEKNIRDGDSFSLEPEQLRQDLNMMIGGNKNQRERKSDGGGGSSGLQQDRQYLLAGM